MKKVLPILVLFLMAISANAQQFKWKEVKPSMTSVPEDFYEGTTKSDAEELLNNDFMAEGAIYGANNNGVFNVLHWDDDWENFIDETLTWDAILESGLMYQYPAGENTGGGGESTEKTLEINGSSDTNFNNLFEDGDVFDKVTVNRHMSRYLADGTTKKWHTLSLPFAMKAEQVAANFGQGAQLLKLSEIDDVFFRFTTASDIEYGGLYLLQLGDLDEDVEKIEVSGEVTMSTIYDMFDTRFNIITAKKTTYVDNMMSTCYMVLDNELVFIDDEEEASSTEWYVESFDESSTQLYLDMDGTLVPEMKVTEYQVTFIADGVVISDEKLSFGAEITVPQAPEKEGYSFFSWGDVPETVPASDLTFTAQYLINRYEVVFVAGEDTIYYANQSYQSTINIPSDPQVEGYTFTGWSPEVDSTVPSHNVTYTALLTPNQYQVTFIADNTVIYDEKQEYGSAITAPTAPEKEGYTFISWGEVAETVPAGDVTYTAEYEINKYTVKFVDEDGTVYSSESLDYGSSITAPDAPTKEGFEFVGWTPEVDTTVPAKDVEYTATWKEIYVDAIAELSNDSNAEYYTTNGIRISAPRKGFNIVKFSNGQVKRIYVK